MAGQQIFIEETIRALKKATSREDNASDSDESIVQTTNRGNKLKRKAKYVQEGKLNNPNGPQAYKRKVEHNGYTREIISRNPMRFDEDGDELEDEEISDNAEIDEEDPYSGIVIEDLLGPLTSVADLPKHPSLSIPYTSPAIAELAQNAAEMVRRENATLWRMKQMFTQLRGDEIWAPCGIFEAEGDRLMFARSQDMDARRASTGRRTDLVESVGKDVATMGTANKVASTSNTTRDPDNDMDLDSTNQVVVNGPDVKNDILGESVAMQDRSQANGHVEGQENNADLHAKHDNLGSPSGLQAETEHRIHEDHHSIEANALATVENGTAIATASASITEELPDAQAGEEGDEEGTTSSEPLSHRMTTRAQAKAPLSKDPSSPTASEETWIHPIFLVPASALPDKDFGLPDFEADETRKLLMLYVQKQEEVVRGAQTLYKGLLQANRMKNDVFKWSKAEGHLGEMSDGEDWYDKEEWKLDDDLVKGREEEEDETNLPGKKTRQRRQ
ncbi:MAG: hypothetical protein Q9165_005106 [Trypethelium subeluteriae]